MLRRLGAGTAVVALLYGLLFAPYTHVHSAIDSVSDEHHPRGHALVHSHATSHAHHDDVAEGPEAEGPDHDERILSVASFVFPEAAPGPVESIAILVSVQPLSELTSVWSGIHRPQPQAHGPPLDWSSPLRAPPAFPPAAV